MYTPDLTNSKASRNINLLCLIVAIAVVLVLPLKKQIWYDETISVLCAKGIGHDLAYKLAANIPVTSAQLDALNTNTNVFHATVKDNANSYVYNIGLHWFTGIAGNSMQAYMLLSKLCSIATLAAFFMLCTTLLGNTLFTSLALLLLATDTDFIGMSHEIRAYSMGMCFVTWAAVYFFKYINEENKPKYLFLLGLFSAGAVLSHFLSVYAILTFLAVLLYTQKAALFSVKNIVAIAIPVAMIALFFLLAYPGLELMSKQNKEIEQVKNVTEGFNIGEVCTRSMRFFALNFKAVFPAFMNKAMVSLLCCLGIIAAYVGAIRVTNNRRDKKNMYILFLLGVSGSLFLALLSIKSHHYTALYYRYYSFCIPFCCLATAYIGQVLYENTRLKMVVGGGIVVLALLPSMALFATGVYHSAPEMKYNHVTVAQQIAGSRVDKLEVPIWNDAFLIHCFLPADKKIVYVRSESLSYFTLHTAGTAERIPVIRSKD